MKSEGDVLAWQALPDDYEYTIASSTVTVSYPKAIQRVAVPRVTVGEASVETGDGQVRFVAQNLEPDSHLIVELGFAPGSLVTQPPQWQAVEIESNRLAQPLALASGALTLLGVGAELATDDSDRLVSAIRDGAQDTINDAGQQIVRRQLSSQPTLTIRPGFPVRVIVTRDLVLDIPGMIEMASAVMTLHPGDIIATGTPAGVGPVVDGDRIRIEIERVGGMTVDVVQGSGGHCAVFDEPYLPDIVKQP